MRRRTWLPATLLPLIALAGCTKDARPRGADSTAASDSSAHAPRALAATEPLVPLEMPQPYRTITNAAFTTYVDSIEWIGGWSQSTDRVCRGGAKSPKCRLEIDGVRGVKGLDPRTLGPNGVIVARIRNLGTEEEATLGIPAGALRYWVMLRDSTGTPMSVFLDPAHRGATVKRYAIAVCDSTRDPRHVHEARSRAAFRCCGRCPGEGTARPLLQSDSGPDDGGPLAPAWVTCATGCCYVEEPS